MQAQGVAIYAPHRFTEYDSEEWVVEIESEEFLAMGGYEWFKYAGTPFTAADGEEYNRHLKRIDGVTYYTKIKAGDEELEDKLKREMEASETTGLRQALRRAVKILNKKPICADFCKYGVEGRCIRVSVPNDIVCENLVYDYLRNGESGKPAAEKQPAPRGLVPAPPASTTGYVRSTLERV